MKTKKSAIDFKEYEPVDALDTEEKALWQELQKGQYESIMTASTKQYYTDIVKKAAKREHASTVRLTHQDQLMAKTRAKEEGLPYQVLLASVIHKWLHGQFIER